MNDRAAHAFHTTNWTQVVAASGHSPFAQQALRELCETYYAPVERFVQQFRTGSRHNQVDDSRDITHEFFIKLLEGNSLSDADSKRGRFRSYLLGAVRNFLRDRYDRERTLKRGGGQTPLSLDQPLIEDESDASCDLEITDPYGFPPDAWFDRQWAIAVVEQAIAKLQAEAESNGESARFEVLQRWLVTPSSHDTAIKAARSINLSEGAFKVAVHRLRKRFRQIVTEYIAQTVSDPSDVKDELNNLLCAITSG